LLSDVWEQIENRDALGKITSFFYKNNKAMYSEYKNIYNLFDDMEFKSSNLVFVKLFAKYLGLS